MNTKHLIFLLTLSLLGCNQSAVSDVDANVLPDGMVVEVDAGVDSEIPDSGSDAVVDSGTDSGADAGQDSALPDAGIDSGMVDSGTPDAGTDSGPVAFCGDGNVDSGEDCDNGLSNAAMSGCETDCSSTRWICGDNQTVAHVLFNGLVSEVAATPVACAVVPGSVELFDGDPDALAAIGGVNFPYAWAPYGPNVHLAYFDNPNIFRTAIVADGSLSGSIASKASACYHIGVTLPHAQCAYLAP